METFLLVVLLVLVAFLFVMAAIRGTLETGVIGEELEEFFDEMEKKRRG